MRTKIRDMPGDTRSKTIPVVMYKQVHMLVPISTEKDQPISDFQLYESISGF
jgi:hypothetical protein